MPQDINPSPNRLRTNVKEFFGHRRIATTLLYIRLEKALVNEPSDECFVRAARKPEEIPQATGRWL
ncbi:MAG: hypothetical protein JSW29_01860 [Candidatus Bathyarchaeota archaeon]|nr:MAG: hypothetical protein JSW29_01860 [Candidatus Bathyarchaeota archaeon]